MEPFTIPHTRRGVEAIWTRWCWGETGRNVGTRGPTYLGLPANGHASSACTSRKKDKIMDTAWRALGLAAGAMQKHERGDVLQRCWPETWRRDGEESKSQRVKERGPHCPEALRPSGLRLLQRAAVLVTDCNLETAGLMTWLVPRWAAGCLPLNEPPSPLNPGALLAAPGLPAAGVEQMPGRAASIPVPGFASAVLEVSWARCRCIRWEQQTRHCATLLTFQMICLVNLSNPYRGM